MPRRPGRASAILRAGDAPVMDVHLRRSRSTRPVALATVRIAIRLLLVAVAAVVLVSNLDRIGQTLVLGIAGMLYLIADFASERPPDAEPVAD